MNGQLSIEHLDGSTLAGMKQDYSGPTVSIGTSPASHICFDADDDPKVVSKHAKLTLDASGVRVHVLDKEVGVLLNDKPVDGSAPVKNGDTLTLGEGGPTLKVTVKSLPSGDAPARTVMGGGVGGAASGEDTGAKGKGKGEAKSPGAGAGVPKRKPGGNQASKPPSTMPGGLAPTVVGKRQPKGAPGQPPPVRVDMGVPAAPSEPASKWKSGRKPHGDSGPGSDGYTPGDQQKTTVGMNTLMGVVNKATKKERGRMVALMVVVIVLLGGVSGGAAYWFWPEEPTPVTNNTTVQTEAFEWLPIAQKVKPSVCLAMMRRPGAEGSESAFGTVWSVGEGVFATNAHVADVFNETGPNGERPEVIIRTPGADPKDLRVKSVRLHPGYHMWEEMVAQYNPYLPGDQTFLGAKNFTTCDVALMYIEDIDIPNQPPPLKLASVEAAGRIEAGREVASFGYSLEGVILNTSQPEPEARFGSVVKVGNSFLASSSASDAEFVWYDWAIAGGASGSPVFNTKGEVVSLISAANMVGQLGGVRLQSSGTSVGPHVRFVKEMLNNTEQADQTARRIEWEASFHEAFLKGTAYSDDLAAMFSGTVMNALGIHDPEKTVFQMVSRTPGTIQVSNGTGKATVPGVKFEPGIVFIFAVSVNHPTPIIVHAPNERPQEPEFSSYYAFDIKDLSRLERGFESDVLVEAGPGSPDGPTEVVIYIFRVINKPQN